jgi:YfiH family protein
MSIIFNKEFILNGSHFIFKTLDQKPQENVLSLRQIHGNSIFKGSSTFSFERASAPEADGVFHLFKEGPPPKMAILTADCLPVALIGSKGMALIHAGWKGLKSHILTRPELFHIEPFFASIGPHILNCCYEVNKPFFDNFSGSRTKIERGSDLFFDLQKEAINQLKNTFSHLKIETSSICTKCNKNFHSYRRNQTEKRNWNVLEMVTS